MTRSFENCSEMFDGDAVVWALMHEAIAGRNALLERGIRSLGQAVWPHWLEVYEQRGVYAPSPEGQLSFVGLISPSGGSLDGDK
jgi:hypothetical protein